MEKLETSRKSLMFPLWFAIGTIIIILIIIKGCSVDTTAQATEEPAVETHSSPGAAAPESIKVKLPDGAEITEASMHQVMNISAILKAYPKVSLKIGGYTDKTGNEQDNQKLSQQRANAVQDAIKKTGAAATQLADAEGYGSQYARAAADAPDEERRADRRISVNVRSK